MGGALMRDGGSNSVIKYANIDETGVAANELVAAVAGATIRVLSLFISATTTGAFNFQDDTGSPVTLLGGTRNVNLSTTAANSNMVLPYNEGGWFETSVGKALDINMASGTFAGCLSYVESTPA